MPRFFTGVQLAWRQCQSYSSASSPGAGASGTVSFPIPLVGEHQVPLTFALDVQPPEALSGFRWVERDDGLNWLCEVDVVPPATGASVAWTALVLVDAFIGPRWRRLYEVALANDYRFLSFGDAMLVDRDDQARDRSH